MATRCVEELHIFVDAETQQSGPYRDTDPVQALGARWTRDAGKLAASIQRDRQQELNRAAERSMADGGPVVATHQSWELTAVGRAQELPDARDIPGGLGVDP